MNHSDRIIADSPPITQTPQRSRLRLPGIRLAILAGILLWLSHPPIGVFPLAWFALIPLCISISRARNFRQALWRGYLFAWAFLGFTWYWIGLTIVAWTGSSIGWVAWFLLTLVLAGFYAMWAGFAYLLYHRTQGKIRLIALAASWVVMEWARTLGSLSMPWAQLSYSQYPAAALFRFVDITGAYGVSFLIALVNAALAERIINPTDKANSLASLRFAGAIAAVFFLIGVLHPIPTKHVRTVVVAAMQGNFPPTTKPEDIPNVIAIFQNLTQQAYERAAVKPELYVWSESAAPNDAVNDFATRQLLQSLSDNYNAAILTGTRSVDPSSRAQTNTSALFVPNTGTPLRYDKVQLVPFGEFIPFRSLFPPAVSRSFGFFEEDVVSGRIGDTLKVGDITLGAFICYESMYPVYARRMSEAGANLLVTQSNDAWFQSRAAMEQHLAAVVFRAAENRKAVVRSTTTGITAFIAADGRLIARLPANKPDALIASIPLREGVTIYARYGDWFVVVCGTIALLPFLKRKHTEPNETGTSPNSERR